MISIIYRKSVLPAISWKSNFLNLINNAFTLQMKRKEMGDGYEPTVSVSTKRKEN
jgi:hypothetical protein